MSHSIGPVYASRDYAGFWRRTLALLIDIVLMSVVWWATERLTQGSSPRLRHQLLVSAWIVDLAYMLGFRCTDGGTLGYRLVGIRYAHMLTEPPTVWLRLHRSLWAVFLLWTCALDHFWILFDERKQAWHDKLAGFYVIKRRAQPVATRPVRRRYIGFFGWSFVVFEPAE